MRPRPPSLSIQSVVSWLLLALVLSSFVALTSASASNPARVSVKEAASVGSTGNFFSAVPALAAPDQFAVSTYADTMIVPNWDRAALLSAGASSSSQLATLRDVGSVYGLAYDDGSVSGVERILMGAFTKRYVDFGFGGVGAIYEYIINDEAFPSRNGSIFTFATGSAGQGLTIHGGDSYGDGQGDSSASYWFGRTGYGDLEVSPDGRTLYAVNLRTKQIDTWNMATGNPSGSISIPFSSYLPAGSYTSSDNLIPFALQFMPGANRNPALVIGITDTAEGNTRDDGGGDQPDVYVLSYVPSTNHWYGLALHQPLLSVPRNLDDGNFFSGVSQTWYPWIRNAAGIGEKIGNRVTRPMPLLTDIAFSRDGNSMVLGIRDMVGDITFFQGTLAQTSSIAQGDTLRYRLSGGAWVFQSGEAYDDNRDLANPGSGADHLENHMGGLATALRGLTTNLSANAGYTEDLRITSLFGQETSGLYNYSETGGSATSSLALQAPGGPTRPGSKAALLGDVEYLTSFALVGGRVWHDANYSGTYQTGEPAMANITVQYLDENGTVIGGATTDSSGVYLMAVPPNTAFSLRLAPEEYRTGDAVGYRITRRDVGDTDSAGYNDPLSDSDASPVSRDIFFGALLSQSGARPVHTRLRDSDTRSYSFGLTNEHGHGEITGIVWNDTDGDSRLESGEPRHNNVRVLLERDDARSGGQAANHTYPRALTTTSSGRYDFRETEPGIYRVVFTPLANYSGSDIANDNHANATSGWATSWFEVNENTLTRNAAMRGGADLWVTVDCSTEIMRGDDISCTINYGNTGGQTAGDVWLYDRTDSTIGFRSETPNARSARNGYANWVLGDLAPGATGTITVIQRSRTTSPDTVINSVEIESRDGITETDMSNNTDQASTRLISSDMRVVKSGPAQALIGDEIVYTITIENIGAGLARDVVLNDYLPDYFTLISASPPPDEIQEVWRGGMIWRLGDIPSGARASFTLRVQSTNLRNSWVHNDVRVSSTTDSNPSNNTSRVETQILRPALSVVKTGPTTPVAVSENYAYSLTVANTGDGEARNVVLSDVLPAGISVVSVSPAASRQAGNTVEWNLGTVPAGSSRSYTIEVTSDINTIPFDAGIDGALVTNTATVTTSTPDEPGDNSSSTNTFIGVPDMHIDLTTASSVVPVGRDSTVNIHIGNSGGIEGRFTHVEVTVPDGLTYRGARLSGGLNGSCAFAGGTRVLSCDVSDRPNDYYGTTTRTMYLDLSVPGDLDPAITSLDFTGTITNSIPEHPSTLADNRDSLTIDVQRPNPYIDIDAPNHAVDGNSIGQGSYFAYTVTYGNDLANLGRPSHLTSIARQVEIQVDLPADVTFVDVDTGNQSRCSESGGTVTCDIGRLDPRTNNQQILVIVQTSAPAGTDLPVEARISTTTPGDDTIDNRDTDSTTVVPPPDEVPAGMSDLTLAIHGDLDPLSQDGDPGNAVYWLNDIAFSWPNGEVLDFTPRLNGLSLPGLPSPYEYRAEVLGWSVVSFTLPDGSVVPATGTDSRGAAGCRGSGGPALHSLTGCMYSYLGGDNLTQIQGSAPDPTELEMHDQARAYWTHPPAPGGMTTEAYVFTMTDIGPVQITVEVAVEIRLVTPTAPTTIGGVPIPAMDFPIPPPRIQVFQGTFDMTPVVPRTIIGPGSVVPGEPVQPV